MQIFIIVSAPSFSESSVVEGNWFNSRWGAVLAEKRDGFDVAKGGTSQRSTFVSVPGRSHVSEAVILTGLARLISDE